MKSLIKTKLAIGACVMTLGAAFLSPSAGHAMQAATLDKVWGKPMKVAKSENNGEIRYFEIIEEAIGTGCAYSDVFYRVFEVQKDGNVIDRGFVLK